MYGVCVCVCVNGVQMLIWRGSVFDHFGHHLGSFFKGNGWNFTSDRPLGLITPLLLQ
jgi:hypothetical protein